MAYIKELKGGHLSWHGCLWNSIGVGVGVQCEMNIDFQSLAENWKILTWYSDSHDNGPFPADMKLYLVISSKWEKIGIIRSYKQAKLPFWHTFPTKYKF